MPDFCRLEIPRFYHTGISHKIPRYYSGSRTGYGPFSMAFSFACQPARQVLALPLGYSDRLLRFFLPRFGIVIRRGGSTPSNILDWEHWRKKVLAGKKIPPPQATVLNSGHRLNATPG